ncbi:MAG: preprotein translocase subunit SecG [Pseudomonadota bacterium]|nr:preprotein translocase subunit SecG [Pseudomonadota bacterium]
MSTLMNFVLALQILTALVMIGLVLIQHGKGADMGASFGSGASGSLFGATGSANFLSRSTAVCAAVFFACTLALAYASNERPKSSGGSVLDRPAAASAASGASAAVALPAMAGASAVTRPVVAAPASPPETASAPAAAASTGGPIPRK